MHHAGIITGLDDAIWLGATDRAVEGTFRWSDTDQALTFTDWRAGDPNDWNGEDCVAIWNTKWIDWVCEPRSRSLCQLPLYKQ